MKQIKLATLCVFSVLSGTGCDSDPERAGELPWSEGKVQVVGVDGDVSEVDLPREGECLVVKPGEEFAEADNCVKPQEECEGKAADVLVDANGKVLDTLCYPAAGTITVAELQANDGGVAQNENNSVIVLDSNPDVDFTGDINLDANNVIIYGDSPETSVLDGSLTVDGNNTTVRGIRITGDVNVVKNNTTFFHCVIGGDLTISANNTVIAGCDVFGKLTISGNNTKLVGNRFVQRPEVGGKNAQCEGNLTATDANGNGLIEASEFGEPLDCK